MPKAEFILKENPALEEVRFLEDRLYDFLNVDAMIAVDVNGTYVLQASLSWTEEVGEAPDLGRATERDASPAAWRLTTGTPRTREGRS